MEYRTWEKRFDTLAESSPEKSVRDYHFHFTFCFPQSSQLKETAEKYLPQATYPTHRTNVLLAALFSEKLYVLVLFRKCEY